MEGKCMLFRQFADIDAFPICLDTKDPDEIVETVVRIAPIFGAINLEDIAAPHCFEVETKLQERLDIPVMHDDQYGTAVVILAALINAAAVVGKRMEDLKIVVAGSGAAGTATIKMLLDAGVGDVIPVDRGGAINRSERYENPHWTWLPSTPTAENKRGTLARCSSAPTSSSASRRPGSCRRTTSGGWGRARSCSRWPTPRRRSCRTPRLPRRRHGDRPLRLPKPGQQPARVSRDLPGRARLQSLADHR